MILYFRTSFDATTAANMVSVFVVGTLFRTSIPDDVLPRADYSIAAGLMGVAIWISRRHVLHGTINSFGGSGGRWVLF